MIFTFLGPSYLLKTARKPVCNSGFGTSAHFMWNNDTYLFWQHILQHYNEDLISRSLKLLPNLTNQQVYPNCYSKVTVKFAVQVLNETTAKTLQTFNTTATSQTTRYCQMLDQFFEWINVRSLGKHQNSFHNLIHGKRILKTGQVIHSKCLI